MSVIGTNIKNVRIKKNLSLKEVAKKCGMTELFLSDVESGKRVPNTQVINAISKAMGVQVDAIEPSYFSDYFDENEKPKKEEVFEAKPAKAVSKQAAADYADSSLSSAFTKATRKIPVLNKLTPGKKVPFEMDVIDNKFEPVFQNKNNQVAGDDFIYFVVPDNSMSGTRILKNDLALVFMTDSIFDKDIILFTYNNKAYIRRVKTLEDKKLLLFPENPDFEVVVAEKKDVQIVGKIVRIEFKI